MKVGIFGAGAIGCYVGGRLAAGPAPAPAQAQAHDVVLLGRASIADEIAQHGLRLTSYRGLDVMASSTALRVSTDVAALADRDVIVVTVKGGDTQSAGESLAAVLADRPDTVVVSLQNGVRNADILRAAMPKHAAAGRVVAAMVPFNVLRAGNGRFHQGTSGRIAMERAAGHTRTDELAAAWRAAGVAAKVVAVADIKAIQWGKLLVNLNNAVNALAGVPIQTMIKDRGYRLVMGAVLDEAVATLRAARVRTILEPPVPAGLVARVLRAPDSVFGLIAPRIIKVDPEARSSMWDDLQRRRITEIDALNGEIVAAASSAASGSSAAPARVNATIVQLVKEAERAKQGSPCLTSADLRARVGI